MASVTTFKMTIMMDSKAMMSVLVVLMCFLVTVEGARKPIVVKKGDKTRFLKLRLFAPG